MKISNEKILTYFIDNFRACKSSQGWYKFDCPICNKKDKAAYHPIFNRVKCWVCSYKYTAFNFIKILTNKDYKLIKEDLDKLKNTDVDSEVSFTNTISKLSKNESRNNISLPIGFKSLFEESELKELANDYLSGRGFDLEYLDDLGFGFCDEFIPDFNKNYYGYIIIPFIKMSKLYYYNARTFIGAELRYKNPKAELFGIGKSEIIWNEDALYLEDKIFIMEGVFSALTVKELGIALGGKAISQIQKEKIINSDVEEVVICLDVGCNKESFAIAKDLIKYKKVKVLTLKDGDPNEIGYNNLIEIYNNTDYLTYKDLILLLR